MTADNKIELDNDTEEQFFILRTFEDVYYELNRKTLFMIFASSWKNAMLNTFVVWLNCEKKVSEQMNY